MGAVVMNAKVSVTITATGDTRKQLSGSDGRFVFTPRITGAHIPQPWKRRASAECCQNVTLVAEDRARVDAQLLYCPGGTAIA